MGEGRSEQGAGGGRLEGAHVRPARGLELVVAGVRGGHDGGHAARVVGAEVLHERRAVGGGEGGEDGDAVGRDGAVRGVRLECSEELAHERVVPGHGRAEFLCVCGAQAMCERGMQLMMSSACVLGKLLRVAWRRSAVACARTAGLARKACMDAATAAGTRYSAKRALSALLPRKSAASASRQCTCRLSSPGNCAIAATSTGGARTARSFRSAAVGLCTR